MKTIMLTPKMTMAQSKIALNLYRKPTTPEIVFDEMLRLAENGIIDRADTLHIHMEKQFNVSYNNYRSIIHRLTKQGLINRVHKEIFINHPFNIKPEAIIIKTQL